MIPFDQPLSAQTPKRPITTFTEDFLLLWHRLHIFPRLARVTYFPALFIRASLSRDKQHASQQYWF